MKYRVQGCLAFFFAGVSFYYALDGSSLLWDLGAAFVGVGLVIYGVSLFKEAE